jgi:transketolase
MRTAFINTLCELAARDERLWLLTADLGFSVLERFASLFPHRYVNVGVAEQNLIGIAAGLAHSGLQPWVYSIANFPTLRCLEQIRNDVCYHHADVKIVAVGGGYAYGPHGYTHHGLEDVAILRALPTMTVVAPADPIETRLATIALAERPSPCYLRLGKARETIVHEADPPFELGKAIEVRSGTDLALLSTGAMLEETVAVARRLSTLGIEPLVLSMHTIKPLDTDAVWRAAQTGAILTIEEHSITGGLGSAVAEALAELGLPVRFRRFGAPDEMRHKVGSQAHLRQLCGGIEEIALSLLSRAAHGRAHNGKAALKPAQV